MLAVALQCIETITKALVWDSSELFENLSARVKRSALLLSAAIRELSSAALGSNTGAFACLYSLTTLPTFGGLLILIVQEYHWAIVRGICDIQYWLV